MAEEKKAVQKAAGEKALKKAAGEAEENLSFIAHAAAGFALSRVDLLDPKSIEPRIEAYLASCGSRNMRPNPPGMAAYLGITQNEFREWLAGIGTLENRALASKTLQLLHQLFVDYALSGKMSPQLAMFFGQNWFGYQNKNAVELQQAAPSAPNLDKLAADTNYSRNELINLLLKHGVENVEVE